jgi:polar amino acid transport system substrate-binding protein
MSRSHASSVLTRARAFLCFSLLLACLFASLSARAEQAPPTLGGAVSPAASAAEPLVVGTHEIAPFVIKNADGTWGGISMDVWRRIADEQGLRYTVREVSIPQLFDPGANGLDVVVSLNVSSRNELRSDLSHAFYSTGLGIATRSEPKSTVLAVVSKIFSLKFARALGVLLLILLVTGVIVWRVERSKKPEEFGGTALRGIGAGVFWAFESVVGKGGALSRTFGNRVVSLLWTATCVLLVSGVTASLSSELTVNKLSSTISGPGDLPRVKVGSVKRPSQAARYLEARSIPFREYDDVAKSVAALEAGEIDAVVFEAPILQYQVSQVTSGKVLMLPGTFQNHGYAFGLKPGSTLRESLNRTLLKLSEEEQLRPIFVRYLGTAD